MHNPSGMITVDFLFATILTFALTGIIFVLGTALTVVEIAQYVTYSSARAYNAGHTSPVAQIELAQEKFDVLKETPGIGNLITNRYFDLDDPDIGLGPSSEETHNDMHGVTAVLTLNGLNFKVPIFGATRQTQEPFQTTVRTYLGRHPSQKECQDVSHQRWAAISSWYQLDNASPPTVIMDNGC